MTAVGRRRVVRATRRRRNPITPPAAPGRVAFAELRLQRMRVPGDAALRSQVKRGISRAADVYALLSPESSTLAHERFWVIPMDIKNRPLGIFQTGQGTVDASIVHPREVLQPALATSASGLIIAHNHPSGDPEPSPEDLALTRRLAAAAQVMGIPVLDHVVLGRGRYVSFAERGLL